MARAGVALPNVPAAATTGTTGTALWRMSLLVCGFPSTVKMRCDDVPFFSGVAQVRTVARAYGTRRTGPVSP